ncbi:MAG: hypothetical protein Q4D06_08485 [Coriobacteriia bacterium]|nr:hypothetical protein [Coriobacteriia bacterium]
MLKNHLTIGMAAGCTVLLAATLTGCSSNSLGNMMGGNNTQASAQATNRAYMSSVNQCIDSLNERLDSFEEAVSNEDMVAMKTKAAKAGEVVAQLEKLEAPESLKDVHQDYVEGCKSLSEALSAYVELYSESKEGKVDSYEAKLKAIQHKYDEGIAQIKEGDDAAAAKGSTEGDKSGDQAASGQKS